MSKRYHSAIMTKIINDAGGRCELCGSKRNLEAHHIIPIICGGEDTEENLICVCYGCHAKLTPRSLLIKMGMRGSAINRFRSELYYTLDQILTEQNGLDVVDVLDTIDYLVEKYGGKYNE